MTYKIYDTRWGLMVDDVAVEADSPINAVKKLYNNVNRATNGKIVVRGIRGRMYTYDGDKK